MKRDKTKAIKVKDIYIGGDAPVTVQSMCNTNAHSYEATIKQAIDLQNAGCEIVRIAIPDEECVGVIPQLKKAVNIPIVADIHFDYRLAILSIEQGADKIRINPGNIGSTERIKKVVDCAKSNQVPIRIGVNSGSIKKDILDQYGNTAKALVESCMENIRIVESFNYDQLVVSLKASSVQKTFDAYTQISELIDYPLHIGVTEAGTYFSGTVKSCVGIGALLMNGLGNTIRVSLTDDPINEIKVGIELLKAAGLRKRFVEIVSCPTCGRTEIDLIGLAKKVEERTANITKEIKVAVMGCIVNGPGEAKDADFGIAGGKGKAMVFQRGEKLGIYSEDDALNKLVELIEKESE